MSFTVLAKTLEIAWVLLESYDVDPLPLFEKAGIDPKLMKDLSARISQSALDKLWFSIAEEVNDPCFGVKLGKFWHPSYMHALGYSWLASSTLRSALNRLVRFIHVVNQKVVIDLSEKNDLATLSWTNPSPIEGDDWRADGVMSVIVSMCRANYGDKLDPVSVSFKHSKPICAGDFYAYFRCPVSFDAGFDCLVLTKESIDKVLPSANPLISQINDSEIVKYLAKLNTNDIIQRTKAAIIEQLADGRASDSTIAKSLHMSNRTLQRKLNESGTTYKKLLTEVRKELAMKYIQNRQLTLTELSFQLGFSEMSAFSRAFKQWTGRSPRSYRQSI
ncbi:MAG: AraC family transcriptional regulator [bacterium]